MQAPEYEFCRLTTSAVQPACRLTSPCAAAGKPLRRARGRFSNSRCRLKYFGLLLAPVLLCSCSSIFTSRSIKEPMMTAYLAGNMQEAERIADDYAASREGSGDELMWRLEQAKIRFDIGKYKESLQAFEMAEKAVANFDERAKISAREAGAEVGSAFTNPNALPYRGFMFDRVLINAYKSLCYLALGDKPGAMVEIRRMHQRQKEAKEYFDAEIRKAEAQIKAQRTEMSEESARSSGNFDSILASNPELKKSSDEVKTLSKKIYGDFINPFTIYLSAVNYLLDSNCNDASVDLRNLQKAMPDNHLVASDLATVSRRIGASLPDGMKNAPAWDYSLEKNVVYVIFENGITAALKEQKIQIILPPPIPTGYSGIAFPVIETFPEPYSSLHIEADGRRFEATTISDMDSVLGSEFNEIFPYIITRLVISTVVKEASAFAAQMAAAQAGGELGKWSAVAGMSIYKYAFNTADTRCWQTLPKKYMIAHLPRPQDSRLSICAGSRSETIKLSSDKNTAIIHVRAPSPNYFSVKVFEF